MIRKPMQCRTSSSGRTARRLALAVAAAALPAGAVRAQSAASAPDIGDLSIEELSRLPVTSVSGRPESMLEAAASIFVITGDDIRRSAATSLPEALRLAPTLQVARINVCSFCMDIGRAFSIQASMNQAKFDALQDYASSPLFSDAERALLDYVTELTRNKTVAPETFERLRSFYSEREICDVVWLVASEHFYNVTNIGMNIHSDMLCDLTKRK